MTLAYFNALQVELLKLIISDCYEHINTYSTIKCYFTAPVWSNNFIQSLKPNAQSVWLNK